MIATRETKTHKNTATKLAVDLLLKIWRVDGKTALHGAVAHVLVDRRKLGNGLHHHHLAVLRRKWHELFAVPGLVEGSFKDRRECGGVPVVEFFGKPR